MSRIRILQYIRGIWVFRGQKNKEMWVSNWDNQNDYTYGFSLNFEQLHFTNIKGCFIVFD